MIFVTVGTHEQQFDRLIMAVDDLAAEKLFDEEILIQTGYSDYKPKHCIFKQFYPYQQMLELVEEARIVITHGGPSSFIMPLQLGKVPIVVPRQKRYGEHVNDHQLTFCRLIAERQKNILTVEEINQLSEIILNYDLLKAGMSAEIKRNNASFCESFESLVDDLLYGGQRLS